MVIYKKGSSGDDFQFQGKLTVGTLPLGGIKVLTIPFVKKTSEYDTTYDLPAKAIVLDVSIEVTTAVASSTIDVGLLSSESGGDADGFVDGVSCASAVFVRPEAAVIDGANEMYYSDTTRGVLLRLAYKAGSNVDGDSGLYGEKYHFTSNVTAKSVSYTTSNHTIAGNIHILYVDTV